MRRDLTVRNAFSHYKHKLFVWDTSLFLAYVLDTSVEHPVASLLIQVPLVFRPKQIELQYQSLKCRSVYNTGMYPRRVCYSRCQFVVVLAWVLLHPA